MVGRVVRWKAFGPGQHPSDSHAVRPRLSSAASHADLITTCFILHFIIEGLGVLLILRSFSNRILRVLTKCRGCMRLWQSEDVVVRMGSNKVMTNVHCRGEHENPKLIVSRLYPMIFVRNVSPRRRSNPLARPLGIGGGCVQNDEWR